MTREYYSDVLIFKYIRIILYVMLHKKLSRHHDKCFTTAAVLFVSFKLHDTINNITNKTLASDVKVTTNVLTEKSK